MKANRKPVNQMSHEEIIDALIQDGFEFDRNDAAEVSKTIQLAAHGDALLWSNKHVISTLNNRPLHLVIEEQT